MYYICNVHSHIDIDIIFYTLDIYETKKYNKHHKTYFNNMTYVS